MFNFQWWRLWYTLLMRSNKFETGVQNSVCHKNSLLDFLVMVM